ncbi:UNVERIFIED_ORG: hypothetical protein J2X74_003187 [Bacillus sp. 1751]|nr:hypothetical protein [Bacillus sp. 1751]
MRKKMNKTDFNRYAKFLEEAHMHVNVNELGGFTDYIHTHLLGEKPMDEDMEEELEVNIDTKFHGQDSNETQYVQLIFQVDHNLIGTIDVSRNEDGEIDGVEIA